MRATIAVLVSTIVLASSSPASGTCAWVLWSEISYQISKTSPGHAIAALAAYPTYEQCDKVRVAKAADRLRDSKLEQPGPNVARITAEERDGVVTKTTDLKDGGFTYWQYVLKCLPDTIDPRGAKQEGSR
jgi:hypothetical protein